jgi:hypothetical protein
MPGVPSVSKVANCTTAFNVGNVFQNSAVCSNVNVVAAGCPSIVVFYYIIIPP